MMQTKRYLLLVLFMLAICGSGYGVTRMKAKAGGVNAVALSAVHHSAVAKSQASILDGHARFTVITPTLIRMEYSKNGQFVNRRSYFAWERNVRPPQYAVTDRNKVLTITTSRMKLVWKGGATGFNADNLSVTFEDADGNRQTWHPGQTQIGNMGGTLHSLDGCSGAEKLPGGVVSRDGWFLYRDKTFLVSNGEHPWMEARPKNEIDDWYFFGYGKDDFHTALRDLTTISGRIPIPPRFMLGSWRSRWHNYTQEQFQQLVLNYDAHRFPLDVLVMDMGWHTTPHWGSMDWNKKIIADPTALLRWLHARDLHVTVNWHPQGGVGPWYSEYGDFSRAIGLNPAEKKVIPFDDSSERFLRNYFKLMMNPLEKQGVDFWWLDDNGPYLSWDNALDFWNIGRAGTGRRGASFSRWGGWGNQRYPVSFSGDTSALWRVLRFEVPFTATAGNVGADYWSNDISGFRSKIPSSELFTRWVEFGALSPVFRTHGTIHFGNYRIPWDYGAQAESATRRAYDLRDTLFPYIYSSAYLTWKTSLPIVRPLYLDFPKNPETYEHREEYEFGPDVLVAPIVGRGIGKAWLGAATMWFPKGVWWNMLTGERVSQPGNHTVLASASEIPVFVRGGVPIPMQNVKMRMAAAPANPLLVRVYPGPDGHFTVYEDDGTSPKYLHGAYALTPLRYENRGADGVHVIIGPTKGSYAKQPAGRRIIVELPITAHPKGVMVDGVKAPESEKVLPGYSYDPVTAMTEIRLPSESIRKQVVVNVTFRGSSQVQAMIPEIVNRVASVQRALMGAGEVQAEWKFDLIALRFQLRTLLSAAEQESGPTSANEVKGRLKAAEEEQSKIELLLASYRNDQSQAAAFALSDAYLSVSVRLRKADKGLIENDVPRYYKFFGLPNDVAGYHAGVLISSLSPLSANGKMLTVSFPGLLNADFKLPQAREHVYAFLPLMKATEHPLYHLRGKATLAMSGGNSQRALSRTIDLKRELLDEWSIAGPFAKGLVPNIGGQTITASTLHHTYKGIDGKSVAWVTWQAAIANKLDAASANYLKRMKRWVNLSTIYPEHDSWAIAATWIDAPKAMTAGLSARHNAGITVWLNDKTVMELTVAGGVLDLQDPSQDRTLVHLQKGWNQIVVRTNDEHNGWGFGLRLQLPPNVVCAQSHKPPVHTGTR
jgi:hypothetical protein